MKNTKSRLANIALSALFTAIICILAQIIIPTPWGVPFTLQIFGTALCGYVLGTKKAVASLVAYILVGLTGVPVFSGFKSGIHTLFGITGGFIFGFLAVALFCGIAKTQKKVYAKLTLSATGIVICHIFGTVQLAAVSKSDILSAFVIASLPFILTDFVFILAAYFVARLINKRIRIR